LDEFFTNAIHSCQESWRHVVATGVTLGVPTPAFSTALAFYDGYRSGWLPANLIQVSFMRDLLGLITTDECSCRPNVITLEHIRMRSLITPGTGSTLTGLDTEETSLQPLTRLESRSFLQAFHLRCTSIRYLIVMWILLERSLYSKFLCNII
jgi:hypothetical protein